MILPHPLHELAGCCWLPRLAAKIRIHARGGMPWVYRAAFGSRFGVDGYFLRHFGLSLGQVTEAVKAVPDDAALAGWFLGRPGVSPQSIASWNRLAPRLGARGQPAHRVFSVVKWVFYPGVFRHPVETLFEALEQDEGLTPPQGNP